MKELKDIIDTWNMIEKYEINEYEYENGVVKISDNDYSKMLNGSRNKKYVENLQTSAGMLKTHGYLV